MIAESVVAMLACARLGAVHSVVFGGFAPVSSPAASTTPSRWPSSRRPEASSPSVACVPARDRGALQISERAVGGAGTVPTGKLPPPQWPRPGSAQEAGGPRGCPRPRRRTASSRPSR
ncbi:hypothetical protein QJS66_05965 [Kocuria rhizophila]|nr:hypothetical protein QJS66_05965 [Kocuria rhizophila]